MTMIKLLLAACASVLLIAATPPASAYAVLKTFNCPTDGCQPEAGVTHGPGQQLYGPTTYGSLYRIDPTGTPFVNLHQLANTPEGAKPVAALTRHAGWLYGVADSGGNAPNGAGAGTLFRVHPSGAFQLLHQFTGPDGKQPRGQLLRVVIAGQPYMFGTTVAGGTGSSFGTIFKYDLTTQTLTSFNFLGGADGQNPLVGLTVHNNFLYGTTSRGGQFGVGTLFKIDLALGTKTILHDFSAVPTDGFNPSTRLLKVNANGIMYGTTKGGGQNQLGTLYKFNPATSAVTLMHSFSGAPIDGSNPSGDLAKHNGNIYGTTQAGGAFDRGSVFKYDPSLSSVTSLHDFGSLGIDGSFPTSGVMEFQGLLYGTTSRYPGTLFSEIP